MIVDISDKAELQDGAMVLPVRVQVEKGNGPTGTSALSERIQRLESDEDTREERIVYVNASKREWLPPVGTAVTLHCFGRHIKAVETETAAV